jgi:hypothetical protein
MSPLAAPEQLDAGPDRWVRPAGEGGTQMHPTVKRLAVLGALGTTLGAVGPVASASAATTPAAPAKLAAFPFPGFPGNGLGGFLPVFPGVAVAGATIVGPAVVGPVVTTTAPSSFINSNNQDSVGGNVAGVQVTGL